MLSLPLINIGLWLFVLKCAFALYNAKYYEGELQRTSVAIQLIVAFLIVTKYVELYSLTIFHIKDVEIGDLSYIAILFGFSTLIQLVALHYRKTILASGLLIVSAVNTGIIGYLSMVIS